MQLIQIKEIKGKLILRSGLHIGSGDTEMHIGGTDNPVIKHPHTQEPYIPGSSLKGKVRALLEMESGLMPKTKGEPVQARLLRSLDGKQREKCEKILKIFGSSGADSEDISGYALGPTRVSFADCPLNQEWRETARNNRWDLFEVKSENAINRIEGTARNPRFTERVVAGAEFDITITLKLLGKTKTTSSTISWTVSVSWRWTRSEAAAAGVTAGSNCNFMIRRWRRDTGTVSPSHREVRK